LGVFEYIPGKKDWYKITGINKWLLVSWHGLVLYEGIILCLEESLKEVKLF
jgi:hypothetical protein